MERCIAGTAVIMFNELNKLEKLEKRRNDMKILVVDDDLHIQRLYKEEFEDEGYEVVIASNGKEAIDLFDNEVPDIVTLDILLPDVDGIRLLRQMKEKRPKVPIIMSTAYDYRDDFAVWASEAYIVKSSDLDELKATIKKLLGKQ
jgi:DNA-binding response OmpR family regulator